MAFPRSLARLNRRVTNPIARLAAGRVPGVAVIEHTGRKSGRLYRTPVTAFEVDGGFAVSVNYGVASDWVKNVLAADGGALLYRRRRFSVTNPQLIEGEGAMSLLPSPLAPVLRRISGQRVMKLTAS